jgi:hypothetical protein
VVVVQAIYARSILCDIAQDSRRDHRGESSDGYRNVPGPTCDMDEAETVKGNDISLIPYCTSGQTF